MFINPIRAIELGWITHPSLKNVEDFQHGNYISPNAIDITLDAVYLLDPTTQFTLSEFTKKMRRTYKVDPVHRSDDLDGFYSIPHGCVDVMSDFHVTVPAGVAAFLIVRSTLNRNGLFVTSGLYDQGFDNKVGFILRNEGPAAYIAPHTRVAQLVFVKSEDSGVLYNGTYNQNKGEHWSLIDSSVASDAEKSVDSAITHNMMIPLLPEESTDVFAFEDDASPDNGVEVIDFTATSESRHKGTLVTELPTEIPSTEKVKVSTRKPYVPRRPSAYDASVAPKSTK